MSAKTLNEGVNFINTTGYKNGFFEFLNDPETCCSTYCCSCLVVGQAVGSLNKTGFDILSCICPGIAAYRLRRRVQGMFGIQESEDASTCAVGLCALCSVCQDVSELKHRGIIGSQSAKTVQPAPAAQMNAPAAP